MSGFELSFDSCLDQYEGQWDIVASQGGHQAEKIKKPVREMAKT